MGKVVYCDICGKPWHIDSDYNPAFSFKDSNGNKFDLIICHDCRAGDKVVRCLGCDCYLRPEDIFSFRKAGYGKYCRQCVEQAIKDRLQEIESVKTKLKDVRATFEHRKVERDDGYETNG